jgi:hypothetical protein
VRSLVPRWVRVAACVAVMAVSAPRVEARSQAVPRNRHELSTLLIERADGGSVVGVRVRIHCTSGPPFSPADEFDPYLDAGGESFDLPVTVRHKGESASVVVQPWSCPIWEYDPDVPAMVVARLPGWRGYASVGEQTPSRLVLQPFGASALSVRVVDDSGDGVEGAPVRLVAPRELSGAKPGARSSGVDRTFAWSRRDGLARFERVDVVRWDKFGGGEMFVQVEAFPRPLRPTALVPRESSGVSVSLDASRLSTLVLEAVDQSGTRLGAVNEFALADAPGAPGVSRGAAGSVAVEARALLLDEIDESFYVVPGRGGSAHAPWIARDARLIALTRRNTLSDWSGTILEPGREAHTPAIQLVPGAACEAVAIEVVSRGARVPSSQLRFRRALRLQSPRPRLAQFAAAMPALLGIVPNEKQQHVLAVWSDWVALSEGELRVDLETLVRQDVGLIQIEHRALDGGLSVGTLNLRALPQRAEQKVRIELTPNEQWVSVVVQDQTGRGMPSIAVTLETLTSSRSPGGDQNTVLETLAFTAADGRLELQLSVDGVHRLRATGVDLGDAVAEGVVAGSEVRLTLGGRGTVRGRLRALGALGGADLNLLLLREQYAVAETRWSGRTLGCSCDGEFEFPDVVHGRYTLIVRRVIEGAPPRELARIERLDVNVHGVFDLGEVLVSD